MISPQSRAPHTTLRRFSFAALPLKLLLASAMLVLASSINAQESPQNRARRTLVQIVESESSWIQIHAAEALLPYGEASAMHQYFTRNRSILEKRAHRVGVWRVLTRTSSGAEKEEWIARIVGVYLDPAAPDRSQAIETICKLGHRLTGAALTRARREAAAEPSSASVLALWSLVLAGDENALSRFTAQLRSPTRRSACSPPTDCAGWDFAILRCCRL